ncbi:MAG: hypothetical protein ACI808_000778 [Paraglaciecola sp.]|jgi:hypothetical protein
MASLAKIQQEFMSLLQVNDRTIEQQVITQGQLSNGQRVDIYRSAYRIRLRGVIDDDHEMLGLYLGDELFECLVNGYIDAMPSQHPSLRFFADRLPDYLRSTLPFAEHPILSEIAGFERALLNAFDSADAESLSNQVLQQIPAENWPYLSFEFHPSLSFYQCHWNAIESWQSLKSAEPPPIAKLSEQNIVWAIWRGPGKLTEYKPVQPIESNVLKYMQDGLLFAEICELMQSQMPESQIATTLYGYISLWLQRGWIVAASWDARG